MRSSRPGRARSSSRLTLPPPFGDGRVVTDLALMSFHPETKRVQVDARLSPPRVAELEILRQLDPDRIFLGPAR